MEKITIVINGVGGCGKDTLIEILSTHKKIRNKSSIEPVKEIAKHCGWDGSKDDKSRKFLSDLKQLLTAYNEYPLSYLLSEQDKFINSDEELMFVHIREPHEIDKFKKHSKTKTYTLLITPRSELAGKVYGNASDDDVAKYHYDFTFNNDQPLETSSKLWIKFIDNQVLNSQEQK